MNFNKLIIQFLPLLIIAITLSGCVDDNDTIPDYGIDKYIGTWNVSDQQSRINYIVNIVENPSNSSEILISNFADLKETAIGLVIDNSLYIEAQSLGELYSVSGIGSYINENKLIFTFDLSDGIDKESRIATYSR